MTYNELKALAKENGIQGCHKMKTRVSLRPERGVIIMPIEEMLALVKERLKIEDDSKDLLIEDVIRECLATVIQEPLAELEPFHPPKN